MQHTADNWASVEDACPATQHSNWQGAELEPQFSTEFIFQRFAVLILVWDICKELTENHVIKTFFVAGLECRKKDSCEVEGIVALFVAGMGGGHSHYNAF